MFNINDLSDGLYAMFVGSKDFTAEFSEIYSSKETEFLKHSAKVVFLESSDLGLSNVNFTKDNLVFVSKNGDSLVYLIHKENPEKDTDWLDVSLAFFENYEKSEPDNNLWKWGQIVPEDGDYLCVDCGYIETLSKGQIFPICEVCLSGEPAGISGPREGFLGISLGLRLFLIVFIFYKQLSLQDITKIINLNCLTLNIQVSF
jgi:hypothetical protein